ncbi:Spermidine synthase (fragment) [Xenorhabdus doucetiae]|uniref:Polyamine aminopropyltransferase n=1 Tax=Xenorhabdus doucetiae TaxID=351671 RepID=A0A068QVX8_9GAMM
MMAHVPLFAHGQAKKVLIIGGGDGGMLREVCRHHYLDSITMVEIDAGVVEFCRQYLPNHHAGAYDDPRFKLVIDNGVNFVKTTSEKFDVIISDCTDPDGPGESLFTSEFYAGCARCLNEGGIFVAQNGVCFLQQDEAVNSHKKLSHYFVDSSFYQAAIPTYYGGIMTFAWATQNSALRQVPLTTLQQRFEDTAITCRYYTPAVHAGSFALPQYLLNALFGNP